MITYSRYLFLLTAVVLLASCSKQPESGGIKVKFETSKGDFALALALGIILLALAFLVNAALVWGQRAG